MTSIFFHLHERRDLPDDYRDCYESIWLTLPHSELVDHATVDERRCDE